MSHMVFSDTRCALGEGPFWHPERRALLWFDILGKRLYERAGDRERHWQFDEHVSAAGWVARDRLLLASETGLWDFDMTSGDSTLVAPLEADTPANRSNDGRADPFGGFWIGTMGKAAEPGAGAIYRFYKGELRKLFDGITISNAICFAPGGEWAYFTDTRSRMIRRVALDGQGWPRGDAQDFIDLRHEGLNPDGADVDADGNLWNAQWGAGRVAQYGPDGRFMTAIGFMADQISCPAFGGDDLDVLFATSAADGAGEDDRMAGATFAARVGVRGQAANRVIL